MKFVLALLIFIMSHSLLFAATEDVGADCLILEDENSIICKYTHHRLASEKTVTFEWIDPNGQISRTRQMTIPPMHGSVYDFRYIKGRELGQWTFKVIDGESTYSTNFILK
ncbi:MAG: hypothetical protein IE909_02910 [Campylobacterales bacterium]|nr:hypothetical protein [Campylobacterales bacterium]